MFTWLCEIAKNTYFSEYQKNKRYKTLYQIKEETEEDVINKIIDSEDNIDLLPLYADKVCSKETKIIVEEHLEKCKKCMEYYNIIKEENKSIELDEKKELKRFYKKIRNNKIASIILTIVIMLGLLIVVYFFNKSDFLMKYKDDLLSISQEKNEEISININSFKYNKCQTILKENADGTIDLYIALFQSLRDKLLLNERFKEFGCINLGWNNYIDENTDINWIEENKKGKIVLKALNNTQIKNIYYLENNEEFKTIENSGCETGECAIEIRKIWNNK